MATILDVLGHPPLVAMRQEIQGAYRDMLRAGDSLAHSRRKSNQYPGHRTVASHLSYDERQYAEASARYGALRRAYERAVNDRCIEMGLSPRTEAGLSEREVA